MKRDMKGMIRSTDPVVDADRTSASDPSPLLLEVETMID